MKRLPLVLVAIVLVFASCSASGRARPRVGLAMHSFDDALSVAIRRSIETSALDKAELAIIDGQNQQSAQELQVDSFFARKLGAIAIDPVNAGSVGPIIDKAKALRIPIVFFDRRPSDESMRSWDKLYFVGTRPSDAGATQGAILAAYWKAEPSADRNRDGAVQFLALDASADGKAASLLSESFVKALAAANIKAERLLPSDNEAEGEEPAALIARFGGKIEAVICADSASALAAIEAFKSSGYWKSKKIVPILSVGESYPSPEIAAALGSGLLLGAVYLDSESQGKAVFDLAYALARGTEATKAGWPITDAKYVWVPYKKYTGRTMESPRDPLP